MNLNRMSSPIGCQRRVPTKSLFLFHASDRMASSLDVMTGGRRMELTLGAGDQEPHYLSYGIHFGTAGEGLPT